MASHSARRPIGGLHLRELARISELVTASGDADTLLDAVAALALDLVDGVEVVAFWAADEAARTLTLRSLMPPAPREKFPVTSVAYGTGLAGWVAEHRLSALVDDLARDPRVLVPHAWESLGLASAFALPIVRDGELRAVAVFLGPEKLDFGPDERDLVDAFAAQVGVVLATAAMFAETEARRAAAEALIEVAHALSRTLDPDLVAAEIVARIRRILSVEAAAVYRFHDSGSLMAVATAADRDDVWETRLDAGHGLASLAVRQRRVLASPDVLQDARVRWPLPPPGALHGITHRAALAAPMLARDRTLGVVVARCATGRVFTPDELRLAQAFADQAAAALDNARLYTEAESRRREAELIADVARSINASLDLDVVLQRLAVAARDLAGSDLARIALVDRGGDALVFRALVGARHDGYDTLRIERGKGLGGRVWATGAAMMTDFRRPDARISADYRDVVAAEATVFSLVVPIRLGSTVEGLIYVDNRSPRPFTERDQTALLRLADHAAIAIRNAQLYAHEREARAAALGSGAALARSEARFRVAAQSMREMIYDWHLDTGAIEWVGQIDEALGCAPGAAPATSAAFDDVVHPDDLPGRRTALEAFIAGGGTFAAEYRVRRRDGAVRYWSDQALLVLGADGRPERCIGVCVDVTERRQREAELRESEAQLRHAQKMEAIGRLAGGIAHDFNNLLTVILGRVETLVGADPLRPPDEQQALELIERSAERASTLTQQLLAFSRRQAHQPRLLDVGEIVCATSGLIRRLVGEDVSVATATACDLGLVYADPGQVEQILMNLAVNARDAMPKGGRLTIETTNVEVREEAGARRAGSWVVMAVVDTGSGMDAATQARIFEPFFTTKEVGKGTGLGLSTVYGIVEQSGGFIEVESEPDEGTAIRIFLPRAPAAAVAAEPAAPGGCAPRGTETILLVEDEDDVRSLAAEMLERQGYRVIEARDATAAACVFEGMHHIDLLLTDVVMPDTNGYELARMLTALTPAMRVLYMSGDTDLGSVPAELFSECTLLRKPFSAHALARKVREVLDAAG